MVASSGVLRSVVLVVATVLMAVAALFAGIRLSGDDSTSRTATRGAFLIAGGPALILMVFVILLTFNVAWKARLVNGRLVATGVLGPVGVDLASLVEVRDSTSRQGQSLILRDDRGSVTVSVKTLAQQEVLSDVATAVARRQQQGDLAVSRGAAGILRVPVTAGTATRGASRQTLLMIGVVLLFLAAIIVGLTIGG